jgi:hypothetical protein
MRKVFSGRFKAIFRQGAGAAFSSRRRMYLYKVLRLWDHTILS